MGKNNLGDLSINGRACGAQVVPFSMFLNTEASSRKVELIRASAGTSRDRSRVQGHYKKVPVLKCM